MSKNPFTGLLRKDINSFIAKAFLSCEGERLEPTSRYVEYVCHHIMRFVEGKTKRLLINLPGRHLKTFICSICVPAFMLGRDPSLRFMIVAYDLSLAEDIVRQIRNIMNSSWYKNVFKKTRIASGHSQKDDFAVEDGGRVRAVPIGSVTGKGGDIIIFDDPHNANHWNNLKKKTDVIERFSTLMTRLNHGVKSQILVVGHRVAEDDLSAHLIERGDFEQLILPLFAPEDMEFEIGNDTWLLRKGEQLRPDAFPADEIETLRREHRGSPFWLHYQQGLGQRSDDFRIGVEHFPFFSGRHDHLPVVISVDPALRTESTSQNVIQVYAVDGKRYILLQAFAAACSFKKLKVKVMKYISCYQPITVLVENTARGPDLIESLRENVPAINVVAINPRGPKHERLQACSYLIQAKQVWIKEDREEAESAIDQIVAFPNCPYDDHVDAMTNFLLWVVQQRSLVKPSTASPAAQSGRAFAALGKRPLVQSTVHMVNGRPSSDGGPSRRVTTVFGDVIIRRP